MPAGSGLLCGSVSAEHKAVWLSGKQRYFAAGGPPRCQALARHGGPCGGFALRGQERCLIHASSAVQREQRAKRLARAMATEAGRERIERREAARVQRDIWRRDRWAPGATIELGPAREAACDTDIRAAGFDPGRISPATLDAARWAWLHMQMGRMAREHFGARLAWHAGRD